MNSYISDWMLFLRTSDPLIGFPLLLGGVGLMTLGWRMWKVCVLLSYGLIGFAAGAALSPAGDQQWFYGLIGAVVLSLAAYKPVKYAVAGLGGVMGAAFVVYLLSGLRVDQTTMWILAAVAFLAATGLAFLNRRLVVIGVTAALGSILALSGLTAFIASSPRLYGSVVSLTEASGIVIPLIFLVPIVMSCFYQEAEVHRLRAEI